MEDIEKSPLSLEGGTDDFQKVEEPLIYDEYVTQKTSKLAKLLGWLDFYDRTYSGKFSRIDNWYCNMIFCFFAWIFNRKQCLLQIPVICCFTYAYPEVVLQHMQKSDPTFDAKSYDLEAKGQLYNLCNFMWVHMTLGIIAVTIFIIAPQFQLFFCQQLAFDISQTTVAFNSGGATGEELCVGSACEKCMRCC